MSTRCTLHFTDDDGTQAICYRHSDGYPDSEAGVLADLERFFSDVAELRYDISLDDAIREFQC